MGSDNIQSVCAKAHPTPFHRLHIYSIFLLGFSSGLPFLLTLSTLSVWLKESGVNNATIGLFVLATVPYTFKFLWGPTVDRVKIPFLFPLFGQRRSWILFSQAALFVTLVGLGSSQPEKNILGTALWAFGVAFFSAIQDIVIEAYRIECVGENQKGPSASAIVLGWKLGMLAAGAGALFVAATFSWQTAYNLMAALMLVGILTAFLSPAPRLSMCATHHSPSLAGLDGHNFWRWIVLTYGQPLKELWNTYDWRIVLAFIFLYKVGDTSLNVMNTPFLVELGFSKLEIANVAKLFGISAMIVGGFVGGLSLSRFGITPSLIFCSSLQVFSCLMFVLQATIGYDLNILVLTMGIENFTSGFGATAFIAYLSSLCSVPHTATHFAILSSFGSLTRIILSMSAGILADILPWPLFFSISALACLPCLLLLIYSSKQFSRKNPLGSSAI